MGLLSNIIKRAATTQGKCRVYVSMDGSQRANKESCSAGHMVESPRMRAAFKTADEALRQHLQQSSCSCVSCAEGMKITATQSNIGSSSRVGFL